MILYTYDDTEKREIVICYSTEDSKHQIVRLSLDDPKTDLILQHAVKAHEAISKAQKELIDVLTGVIEPINFAKMTREVLKQLEEDLSR